MKDLFTIQSSVLPASTRVAGFRGTEALSRPYLFEIYLVMANEIGLGIDMADAIGAKATLTLDRDDRRPPFRFNGILASLELIHDYEGRSVFRAVLVPSVWKLTLSLHSRIFAGQSSPDIIKAVLAAGGVSDVAFKLRGKYKPEEHVCQYRESDFDFISRWMEREGMYYYFEQKDGGETLVITDDAALHQPLGEKPVRYSPQPGTDVTAGECFRTFTCRHSSLPTTVRLKDYDYSKPSFDVSGNAPVSPKGFGEISVYGARFFSPSEGSRLAGVKAQELLAGQVVYQGVSTAWYLRSGYTFEVEDHPRPAFNTAYLTTELEHWGNQTQGAPELKELLPWEDVYRVELTAIPASTQYRAPQRTPWPRIYGTENAVVDGPATSEYAQIDEFGRYSVKFHFDESALTGGRASTKVRMLQPHGGGVEGFHFPLRAGTEVMCTFLGGDPDRPMIAGVAPNLLTPSPVTVGNHTRNIIQTGGRNRLELEDQAGQQRVTLSTPQTNAYLRMGAPNADHNVILHTDGRALHDTGSDLDIAVGGYKHEGVKGPVVETYQDTKDEQVTKAVTEVYQDTKKETVTGAITEEYLSTKDETVTGAVTEIYKDTKDETVTGAVTEKYKSDQTTTVDGDQTIKVEGTYKLSVKQDNKRYIEGNYFLETKGSSTNVVLGSSNSVVVGLSTSNVVGGSISNVAGGSLSAFEGGALMFTLGARANVVIGSQFGYNLGPNVSMLNGISVGSIVGGKFEDILGFKIELLQGLVFKNVTGVEIKTEDALVDYCLGPNISTAGADLAMRAIGITVADLEAIL